MRQVGDEWETDAAVTFLMPDEQTKVHVDLTKIALNPPKW